LKGNKSQSQPRIWVNGKEKKSLRLRPDLGRIDEELNNVTSSTSTVIMSLLSGGTLHTSVPGVAGLPGGYPFVLQGRKFTLQQLPAGNTDDEAIAHNKTGE
jgi:hypothetical protein